MDKHLCDCALQHIISNELKEGRLLHYNEAFKEDKILYAKVKVCISLFIYLLSNPLIWNLLTFFFLIFFGFCFLQDYDYGQIYVVLTYFHNTPAEAFGYIDPTPIGFTTDDVPVSQQVALAFDHVVATSFSHEKFVVHVHKS
jgi:hypothetical protein